MSANRTDFEESTDVARATALRWLSPGMVCALLLTAAMLWASGADASDDGPRWRIEVWDVPLDFQSPSRMVDYAALESASSPWTICASFPHLKDSYWLSVNYGMVEEARRLGVGLRIVEAGGYPNIERQISQVLDCVNEGADVLALGTVSFDGLTETVLEVAERIPVVAIVNDIADPGVSAKAGVSWTTMGRVIGEDLAARHPAGSDPVKVAWFPGPEGSGWVPFVEEGFRSAVSGSAAQIVVTKYGDTGREIQILLVEEALEERPDIDYIVGSAVTAEAAMGVLRARGLEGRIQVMADYFTHAVYRGIKRARVVSAPTDFPVLQGRLGVDMAIRVLEGKLDIVHAGPEIQLIDASNVDSVGTAESLAPADFEPTFVVP